jgi:hypothetical protein
VADSAHINVLESGENRWSVTAWNSWRADHPSVQPDLSGANLSNANLRGINFENTDLTEATLVRSTLTNAILRGASLTGADLRNANLAGAHLQGANLTRAFLHSTNLVDAQLEGARLWHAALIEADLTRAHLRGAEVYGAACWNVILKDADQAALVITGWNEPRIVVDDLELAQFIYLLLNRSNLRRIISAVTQRGVLILGRFAEGGHAVLSAVAEELRTLGYLPIIFDFDRPDDRNRTETVRILVGLSRFVIADLSGPSVPHELQATVPDCSL